MASAINRLVDALVSAGLPCVGTALLQPDREAEPGWLILTRQPGGQRVRLDTSRPLTPAELATAQTTLDTFDPTPRRPRTISDLIGAINALSALDRSKLALAIQAAFLQDHPLFARALGISLDGDEPAVAAAPLLHLQSRPVKG